MIKRELAAKLRGLLASIAAGHAVIAAPCVLGAEPVITDPLAGAHASESHAERRFKEGLRLAQTNKLDEAANLFLLLTQDYPLLPEPYEQLAAVYQRQGNTQGAIGALRSAIGLRADPTRLQEQLGDLYLELAAQAFGSAVQSEHATDAARQKYSEIEALSSARAGR